jgi:uncharacterized protein
MRGYSWSGINALQVAARQPAGLSAVVSACPTDDRYRDDAHHTGGALIGDQLWATFFLMVQASPPDPAVFGNAWLERWRERLDSIDPPLATWLRHQRRDGYWRHGSLCEDYDTVHCPVLLCGGWMDAYVDPVLRMLENLRQALAIIGPWSHHFPHQGNPRSAISLSYEIEWWEHWLCEIGTR